MRFSLARFVALGLIKMQSSRNFILWTKTQVREFQMNFFIFRCGLNGKTWHAGVKGRG